MLEIDLHGFDLDAAFVEIHFALKECHSEGIDQIKFIHGYRSGGIIKSYIRSAKFLKQMKKAGFNLKPLKSANPGTSIFQIM